MNEPEHTGLEIAPLVGPEVLQCTLRSLLTGMVLGAALSLCNIYTGLKVGWSTNMSITSVLLAYAFWLCAHKLVGTRPFGILENNLHQAAASAAASISSAGLVAPIPALTLLTGRVLPWHWLALWVFAVSCVGIVVAVAMRRQLLLVDRLPFPFGIATGKTLTEMYSRGRDAIAGVVALLSGGVLAAAVKAVQELWSLKPWGVPLAVGKLTLKNLTFAVEPSLLFIGMGGLIGMRACMSLLIGAVAGWGFLAPWALAHGYAQPGKPDELWFAPVVGWLLWPGVAMMVTSSLTSFVLSGNTVIAALRGARRASETKDANDEDVPRRWVIRAALAALVLASLCQIFLFDIHPVIAVAAVLFTFALAIVAARVTGETGITPQGPMGKVTQLVFGLLVPGNATANLMSANVTGGAAAQCGDLLHDLRTGLMLGAWPRFQALSQTLGALAGALVGSAAYLLLIPDPKSMLIVSPQWPAPAVLQWKTVAEVFQKGFAGIPPGAAWAMAIGGGIGIAISIAEKLLTPRYRRYLPSAPSIGLALVIPAYYSTAMFVGGVIVWIALRIRRSWTERYALIIASGLVAGESLAGVGFALKKVLGG